MSNSGPFPKIHFRFLRTIIILWTVGFGLALSACSPVPLNLTKPESVTRAAPAENSLRTSARQITKASRARSTFVPLVDGNEALGARLQLIEDATDTLDLQYFLIKPDLGAALILEALLRAADRGVRVRFLLDDIFTTTKDQSLSLLNVHPNIEVRIFNPSMRPGPKFAGFITEFGRINRRMHNKTVTADNAFSIIGGRNIADEYFQLDTTSEFADFEMLAVGQVVPRIASTFDLFWNDGWAIPIDRLRVPPTDAELADARAELAALLEPARAVYDGAVNDPYFERLRLGQVPIYSGNALVVTDDPGKLKVPVKDGQPLLGETILRRMRDAKSDVLLLTPYFVPEDYGTRLFADLARRGVRVRIVTNSLGSTNHAYVHAGYRRHRATLLAAGVELYEIRADALQFLRQVPEGDTTSVVMHTKLAVIDGAEVFVGSLNLDPRSIKQNTEFGVFIESQTLATEMLTSLESELSKYTYRLRLADDGSLQWLYRADGQTTATTAEPGATFWKNLVVGFTALLSIESQL